MEIIVAKSSGFCFGVKRAINMADKCASEEKGDGIYTLGPIIHNPQVVKRLEESNVFVKKSLSEIDAGTVIIRSHGVKSEEYREAREKGLNIVDATCPFVKKAQDLVSQLTEDGYEVVVVGEKDHPEVKGLISYGSKKVLVAGSIAELVDMPRVARLGIVAQTTIPMEKLEDIVSFCLHKASELKVFNTICNATSTRQTESAEMARKVDVMIVVGGKNSANTRRLAEVCLAIQPMTYHIEVAAELDHAWFSGARRVGVTSGASTPEWLIEEVVSQIGEFATK
ncbi:MAG TPA: 4-hydroxy-3-methylbut-2-enyl diphosphate reductase [Deltaproteobacteria bacterium]|nr:MAG: 4-hydroxy-3-methylbut-2-enyl diphosphate reductase [Deltaproteobacteria bacterium GWA2_55_82]OGQ63035.1 MAG: 4-hydroxy-3-methylbut-2-enyl diphosphate reductase [Deltaproteobacteria bacterium RIFCSPLOWO2_02_FULL_55_12]OIJ73000.1 MAG: 4-hydroxy-3-methylbut-2-enyl diphosphate reductase [Deltaproteobacteria bacterium GWC2_55_46]HBG45989.1 4-hydroxy-3-methylbut-2-enyl diphosphate reductase [Deltaproteobacteria bacterium]HCY11793.1 4-hydroxy-3-methylbut-2-enyl diphosphate reductase [Deltaprot